MGEYFNFITQTGGIKCPVDIQLQGIIIMCVSEYTGIEGNWQQKLVLHRAPLCNTNRLSKIGT